MKSKNNDIAITLGDPCGIGAQVTAKALRQLRLPSHIRIHIVGDRNLLLSYGRLPRQCVFYPELEGDKGKWTLGRPSKLSGLESRRYLDFAISLIKSKKVKALVTAPVSKEMVAKSYRSFQGHTEYLAKAFSVRHVDMVFVAPKLLMTVVTRHIPLNQVSRQLSVSELVKTIAWTYKTAQNVFKKKNPRLAVCGLNPHAGEHGLLGKEDERVIVPAIRQALKKRIFISGPHPADTIFTDHNRKQFDAIIAMYHDQGLTPMKALYFNQLVNLTVGLPFTRTSPAHGTAFDIAGRNQADSSSMAAAIKLALKLSS